jgi:hypothetical protein
MHQRISYGFSGRDGVLPLDGECDEDYRAALLEDFTKARDGLREGLGVEMQALAFPFGLNTDTAVEVLKQVGVKVSVTTNYGVSVAVKGQPDSIQQMDRWWIGEQITGEELLEGLASLCE